MLIQPKTGPHLVKMLIRFLATIGETSRYLRNPVIRRTLGFLYDGFENDQYYFEPVFLLRKLAYAGLANVRVAETFRIKKGIPATISQKCERI